MTSKMKYSLGFKRDGLLNGGEAIIEKSIN